MARGSWPLLAAAAVLFAVAFAFQRSRSTFLAIEGQRAAAQELAAAHGLTLAQAFALRDLVGVAAPPAAWAAAAAVFAREQPELGEGLAAVAAAGGVELARAARRAAADAATAWRLFAPDRRALPGQRFLQLRDRFAARAAARD
jgi:hypothetical protein